MRKGLGVYVAAAALAASVEFLDYIPDFAFKVRMTGDCCPSRAA
ncbi:MAG TPA: hypothetical protein VFU28_03370 [Vicinamibacterales bacterium]|nr:hypothetical protein [Vicinamibacterales bacterium]